MVRLFPFSYFANRRKAQEAAWAAGNAALEQKIQHHVEEHAKAAAEALFSHRGRKVRKGYLPDKDALAREIAAHRLSLLKLRGGSLLRKANKAHYGYTPLTLGFASFAAETALKGPFAIKHRLGSFGEVMHQVYGDKATMSSEAKRLGRFYNQLGLWRFFTRNTQPVSLAWMAGRMHQWTVIPQIPKPLVKLFNYLPVLPKVFNFVSKVLFLPTVYSWSSNSLKLYLLRKEMGAGARYGLKLSRKPAKLLSVKYGEFKPGPSGAATGKPLDGHADASEHPPAQPPAQPEGQSEEGASGEGAEHPAPPH